MSHVGRHGRAVAGALDAHSLSDLLATRIAAIWCKGFVGNDGHDRLLQRIFASDHSEAYRDQTSVATLGLPLGLLLSGALTASEYPRMLASFLQDWPPDDVTVGRLRHEVEACGFDFVTASWDGLTLAPYVFRVYRPGSRLQPHIDRRIEPPIQHLCASARLAVNIYLLDSGPDSGALELWDLTMPSAAYDEIEALPERVQRERLGPPHIVIQPHAGDCVIFDAERIHAVATIGSGCRVTCSCFIGVDLSRRRVALFA